MENGAVHVARGTSGDRNAPKRSQRDAKLSHGVQKGSQRELALTKSDSNGANMGPNLIKVASAN